MVFVLFLFFGIAYSIGWFFQKDSVVCAMNDETSGNQHYYQTVADRIKLIATSNLSQAEKDDLLSDSAPPVR